MLDKWHTYWKKKEEEDIIQDKWHKASYIRDGSGTGTSGDEEADKKLL